MSMLNTYRVELQIVNEDTQWVRWVEVGPYQAETGDDAKQDARRQYPELEGEVIRAVWLGGPVKLATKRRQS